jgi:hypothetical protein
MENECVWLVLPCVGHLESILNSLTKCESYRLSVHPLFNFWNTCVVLAKEARKYNLHGKVLESLAELNPYEAVFSLGKPVVFKGIYYYPRYHINKTAKTILIQYRRYHFTLLLPFQVRFLE